MSNNTFLYVESQLTKPTINHRILSLFLCFDLEMSQIRQLADTNVGSSDPNSNSSNDESMTLSALRKVVLQVMAIRSILPVIEPILEPLIRRVVKEEFELVKERILASMNQNSRNKIHCSEPRNLQLRFLNKLSSPVLTGSRIIGENCSSVKIALVDAFTEEVVKFGPEASAKVEIVVLRVDIDEGHDWTQEKFNLKIVKERKENEPLLTGNAFLNLKEGVGSVDKISFANRRSWLKKRQYRLGARIVDNFNGTRVREAKSEPFSLEDCRGKLYEKRCLPSPSDEVWRLKNIRKGGPLDKRLSEANIKTVGDFLKQIFTNRQGLRDILGTGMPDKKLDVTVEHALTCKLNDRHLYPPPSSQVVGVLSECHYVPIDNPSETEKYQADAQKLVVSAFEQVVPYDDNLLLRNALLPSNSTRLESPSSPNVVPSHVIPGYDHTPTSTSQGIISSNNSIGTSSVIDPSWFTISEIDCIYGTLEVYDHSGAPCQVPNHQMSDPIRDLDREESQDVAIDKAQSRKWFKMSIVLKFSLSKRTKDSDHVRKKQRLN